MGYGEGEREGSLNCLAYRLHLVHPYISALVGICAWGMCIAEMVGRDGDCTV